MNSQKKEHVTITEEDVINIADENVSKLHKKQSYLRDQIKGNISQINDRNND